MARCWRIRVVPLALLYWLLCALYFFSSPSTNTVGGERELASTQSQGQGERNKSVVFPASAAGEAPQQTLLFKSQSGNNKQQQKKVAYATFLASTDFYPALQVFLYSLNKTAEQPVPLLVCVPAGLPETETDVLVALARSELGRYDYFGTLLPWEIHLLPQVLGGKLEKKRWRINWTKLQLWALVTFDKILFVDLDVLVLQPLHEAFSIPFKIFLGSHDWGKFHAPSEGAGKKMNGGVFLLQPSYDTLAKLLRAKARESDYAIYEVEQGLFNSVFASRCCLPAEYNVQKSLQRYWPGAWNLSIAKVLHFVGEKPWASWASTQFRETVPRNVRDRRSIVDSWDADLYPDLHGMWKDAYLAARQAELAGLDFVVSQEARDCWRLLGGYLPTSTSSSSSASASALPPATPNSTPSTTALALLSAAVEHSSRAFVGLATCAAARSLERPTGIDWTKVAFSADTLYYWSAVYSPDYKRDIEARHPGLGAVLAAVCDFASLRDEKEGPMEGYFANNLDVIGSRSVLQTYTQSAASALASYASRYPATTCAFALPSHHASFPASASISADGGCLEVLICAHLNLWLRARNLRAVFAADEDVVAESKRAWLIGTRRGKGWRSFFPDWSFMRRK